MGDFNLPNIDWTLGRPTPTPGSKLLQLVADNDLSQHGHEPTRQNNVLDLIMTTEEEIVSNVKIGDKIGDHQTVYFSVEAEKESTALEKYNFNFRRAIFDAMHDELVILERLIEGTDAAQGFKIFKNRVNDASSRHFPRKRIAINNPSWINNDVKQAIARQRAYEPSKLNNTEKSNAEYATAKRQVKRTVKQAKRSKETNIATISKSNPKCLYSYINERRKNRKRQS